MQNYIIAILAIISVAGAPVGYYFGVGAGRNVERAENAKSAAVEREGFARRVASLEKENRQFQKLVADSPDNYVHSVLPDDIANGLNR